jgi:hypothetical protein
MLAVLEKYPRHRGFLPPINMGLYSSQVFFFSSLVVTSHQRSRPTICVTLNVPRTLFCFYSETLLYSSVMVSTIILTAARVSLHSGDRLGGSSGARICISFCVTATACPFRMFAQLAGFPELLAISISESFPSPAARLSVNSAQFRHPRGVRNPARPAHELASPARPRQC